jgi:hypothetical protein
VVDRANSLVPAAAIESSCGLFLTNDHRLSSFPDITILSLAQRWSCRPALISWTVGVATRWLWPGNSLANFDTFYRVRLCQGRRRNQELAKKSNAPLIAK